MSEDLSQVWVFFFKRYFVEEPSIKQLIDVVTWFNWRRKKNPRAISGKTLYKIMLTMSEKYDFTWEFTNKANCGKRIVELLERKENEKI